MQECSRTEDCSWLDFALPSDLDTLRPDIWLVTSAIATACFQALSNSTARPLFFLDRPRVGKSKSIITEVKRTDCAHACPKPHLGWELAPDRE